MISAANAFGCGGPRAPRAPSYTGMGHQALLSGFMEELRKVRAKSCERDVEELKRAGMSGKLAKKSCTSEQANAVTLTQEQRLRLANRYDPKNMTWEDYQAFIDDLCEIGILGEADKSCVNYGTSEDMVVIPLESAFRVNILEEGDPFYGVIGCSFSDCQGNALNWAEYRSKTVGHYGETGTWHKTKDAVLFGKVRDVMKAISY